jgi:hypothetical protein
MRRHSFHIQRIKKFKLLYPPSPLHSEEIPLKLHSMAANQGNLSADVPRLRRMDQLASPLYLGYAQQDDRV